MHRATAIAIFATVFCLGSTLEDLRTLLPTQYDFSRPELVEAAGIVEKEADIQGLDLYRKRKEFAEQSDNFGVIDFESVTLDTLKIICDSFDVTLYIPKEGATIDCTKSKDSGEDPSEIRNLVKRYAVDDVITGESEVATTFASLQMSDITTHQKSTAEPTEPQPEVNENQKSTETWTTAENVADVESHKETEQPLYGAEEQKSIGEEPISINDEPKQKDDHDEQTVEEPKDVIPEQTIVAGNDGENKSKNERSADNEETKADVEKKPDDHQEEKTDESKDVTQSAKIEEKTDNKEPVNATIEKSETDNNKETTKEEVNVKNSESTTENNKTDEYIYGEIVVPEVVQEEETTTEKVTATTTKVETTTTAQEENSTESIVEDVHQDEVTVTEPPKVTETTTKVTTSETSDSSKPEEAPIPVIIPTPVKEDQTPEGAVQSKPDDVNPDETSKGPKSEETLKEGSKVTSQPEVNAKSDDQKPKFEKKNEEVAKKGKSMYAAPNAEAAKEGENSDKDEPTQHGSTENTSKAGPSKDTTILVFLFVAVIVVGAVAFGYNFIKKRKQQSADLERVERGPGSAIKRSLQSLTKPDQPEQEMKPLIKGGEQEMVDMKKQNNSREENNKQPLNESSTATAKT